MLEAWKKNLVPFVVCAAVAMLTMVPSLVLGQTPPNPNIAAMDAAKDAVGVDGLIANLITGLAGLVAIIAGGYFAFLLIKKAFGWGGKSG